MIFIAMRMIYEGNSSNAEKHHAWTKSTYAEIVL